MGETHALPGARRFEVFIQAFPPAVGKWQISNAGGAEPQWRGDGRELFYTTLQDPARLMAVDIADSNGAIRAGIPHPLSDVRLPGGTLRNRFVPSRDGKKFLAIVPPEQKAANSFTGDCEFALAAEGEVAVISIHSVDNLTYEHLRLAA